MQSKATSVAAYINSLPAERATAIKKVRAVIRKNLPKGFTEVMNWGMIIYQVPLTIVPNTYNKQPLVYAGLASQKNHMAVYLSNVYASPQLYKWFTSEYKKTGKKLNMGKSCVRFTKLENLPLELVGKAIKKTSLKKFIAMYTNAIKR